MNQITTPAIYTDCFNVNEKTFQTFALKMKPYLYPGTITIDKVLKQIN